MSALKELDTFLSVCHPVVEDLASCTPAPLTAVTVHTNVLSPTVIKELKSNLATAIVAMNPTAMFEGVPLSDTVLASGELNLQVFNRYRCFANNFGNLDFAYLFLQPPEKKDYARLTIDEQEVLFDINTMFSHVTLPMLLHQDSSKLLDVVWGLCGDKPAPRMLSWDSIKLANRPSHKPKSMTLQKLTEPHMDIYSADKVDRIQSLINLDERQFGVDKDRGGTKLFFVPGTEHPIAKELIKTITGNDKLYDKTGYVAVKCPELLKVLLKHAVAPPYNSMVSWPSQVIHFEGKAGVLISEGPRKGLYTCRGLQNTMDSIRLRIPVGTQATGDVSQSGMKKLGLAALMSFIAAVYFKPNADNKVGEITVALKSTQKRKRRILSIVDQERIEILQKVEKSWTEDTFDKLVTNPNLRQLLGVWD